MTFVTFGSRRLNPGEVRPQSRGGHASFPRVTEVTARFPGPKPKSHESRPIFPARPPKSHKSRPVFPTRPPKSHKSRPSRPAPKPKSHASIPGPLQKSQVTARFLGPETQKSRVTAGFPARPPKSHRCPGAQKSQLTALPPGPETQKSRLNSRPRPPRSHKSRPLLPAQAPQKSQVTARFPRSHAHLEDCSAQNLEMERRRRTAGRHPGPRRPKVTTHGPPARPPQKSQVTAPSPGPGPPKVTSHAPPSGPKTRKSRLNSRPRPPQQSRLDSKKSRPLPSKPPEPMSCRPLLEQRNSIGRN